jgi:Ca-activated chloride channel family protein
LLTTVISDDGRTFDQASADFRFASAVAAFGMILRDSEHKGIATIDQVLKISESAMGADREGYRRDFIKLAKLANAIGAEAR